MNDINKQIEDNLNDFLEEEENFEDCGPTIGGYKVILQLLKEVEQPNEQQLQSIKEIEAYLERKGE